jgi:hypothetical protein
MKLYTMVLMLTLALSGCAAKKKAADSAPESVISSELLSADYISLFRSGCFGTCPVYQLKIMGNGDVIYYGRQFVSMIGIHVGSLDQSEVAELFESLNEYQWKKYPEQYPIDNVDFPQFVLEYQRGDFIKVIRGNSNTDKELLDLTLKLDSFTDQISFQKEKE